MYIYYLANDDDFDVLDDDFANNETIDETIDCYSYSTSNYEQNTTLLNLLDSEIIF